MPPVSTIPRATGRLGISRAALTDREGAWGESRCYNHAGRAAPSGVGSVWLLAAKLFDHDRFEKGIAERAIFRSRGIQIRNPLFPCALREWTLRIKSGGSMVALNDGRSLAAMLKFGRAPGQQFKQHDHRQNSDEEKRAKHLQTMGACQHTE